MRSCQYMQPDKGSAEAKRLLKKHFGDDYRIATAYIDKALSWPSIKVKDPEALKGFSVFLSGCLNAMDTMEEMDHATNMKAILAKLPHRIKEKWRVKACDLDDRDGRRAHFADLVQFVDIRSRILSHPMFGKLKEKSAVKWIWDMFGLISSWNVRFGAKK